MTRRADPQRSRELAAIHAGKRQLGLSDDAYRDLIEMLTGKRSAAELTSLERAGVIEGMRRMGFKRTGRSMRHPARVPGRGTPASKARDLWAELEATGTLKQAGEGAFQAFVERQTGKSRVEWCTPKEMTSVIEGLKAWLHRVQRGH